ncbi:MAG: hypothetical protein Kow00107_11350 [Planctomycetota bacterium]
MRDFLLIFSLTAVLAASALLLGNFVEKRAAKKVESERFSNWITEFRSVLLVNPALVTAEFLSATARTTGHEIVVFKWKGPLASNEPLLALNFSAFEEAVKARSHADVSFFHDDSEYKFASIPVAAHPDIQHIFIERPRETGVLTRLGLIEWVLVVSATLLGALVATLLLYWLYPLRAKDLARFVSRSAEDISVVAPHSKSFGAMGKLALELRKSVTTLRRKHSRLIEEEKMAAFRQVTAGIAHEVRNPLTAIRMTAQMMKKKHADKQSQEWLQVIISEIDRLKNHMDQLMEFGKQYEPVLRQADVTEIIRETLLLMHRQLEHAKITVITSFEDSIPQIFIDAAQIRQVLLNVIINSIQAMPHAGTLTVSAGTAKVEGQPVCTIAVEDTGSGIPEEIRDRIFEPFFSTKKAGTGLGLATARQIIEMHGGKIRCVSSPKGTIFRIFIPLSPEGRRLSSIETDHFKTLETNDG